MVEYNAKTFKHAVNDVIKKKVLKSAHKHLKTKRKLANYLKTARAVGFNDMKLNSNFRKFQIFFDILESALQT